MRAARLRIEGFRGIRNGEFVLHQKTAIVGSNGCGKSTIVDALSLVLGKPRMVRNLTEHDFTGSCPKPSDRFTIVATIADFSSEDPSDHPDWFRMGRAIPKWIDAEGKLHPSSAKDRRLAGELAFAARFDHTDLTVETQAPPSKFWLLRATTWTTVHFSSTSWPTSSDRDYAVRLERTSSSSNARLANGISSRARILAASQLRSLQRATALDSRSGRGCHRGQQFRLAEGRRRRALSAGLKIGPISAKGPEPTVACESHRGKRETNRTAAPRESAGCSLLR